MKVIDTDISSQIRNKLPVKSFIFNPSIAHITDDKYLLSVRSVKNDLSMPHDYNHVLNENPQHPWYSNWNSEHDLTYIFPCEIVDKQIKAEINGKWPIELKVQDLRIFKFIDDGDNTIFICTYNQQYTEDSDLIIKGGNNCGNWCYLIGWSYIIVNRKTLDYTLLNSEKPLCLNISNPVEKNWSMWRYDLDDLIYLFVSYSLTPVHTAFSFTLDGIKNREIVGGSTCKLITPSINKKNIFGKLEEYYEKNLFVSLSTPSYEYKPEYYQSVGHIKVTIDYIKSIIEKGKRNPLVKFYKEHILNKNQNIHLHPKFIYLMFIYRFNVTNTKISNNEEVRSNNIQLTNNNVKMKANIISVSPAFIINNNEYDYYLNFPSGMVMKVDDTIISYGNGDASSHLLFINNEELDKYMIPTSKLSPYNFEFEEITNFN